MSVDTTLLPLSRCNSSPIAAKLGGDVPWVKILAEFIHGRHGSFNEHLMS